MNNPGGCDPCVIPDMNGSERISISRKDDASMSVHSHCAARAILRHRAAAAAGIGSGR